MTKTMKTTKWVCPRGLDFHIAAHEPENFRCCASKISGYAFPLGFSMKRNLMIIFSLLFTLTSSYGVSVLPAGWREIESEDVKKIDPKANFDPGNFKLMADFDGDSVQDEARVLIDKTERAAISVFLKRGASKPIVIHIFNEEDKRDLLARPKLRFGIAPKNSEWAHNCKDNYSGPRTIKLSTDGIMFEHEDPGADPDHFYGPYIFYWLGKSKTFLRFETC
jgi:hypothetical protein